MIDDLFAEYDSQRRKVDVDNFDVTVRELVRMVSVNEIDRAAEYQRKFRWGEIRESRLVESLLLGLPVPTLFVATNKDGTWELVDGLQRLSSVVHFVDEPIGSYKAVGKTSPLRLSGLEKLSTFNGKCFADLPDAVQLHFLKRSIRVTALSDKSDLDVRFDTFERLNTGGIELSPQEIRSCVFRGPFIEFLDSLGSDENFRSLIKVQKGHLEDGTFQELVLKIFAYKELRESFDGGVTKFLNDYCKNVTSNYKYNKRSQLFTRASSILSGVFNGPILKKGYSVTPLNLAEAIFVAAAEHVENGELNFRPKKGWIHDKDLQRFSTKGTNTRNSLNGRIDRASELLLGASVKI